MDRMTQKCAALSAVRFSGGIQAGGGTITPVYSAMKHTNVVWVLGGLLVLLHLLTAAQAPLSPRDSSVRMKPFGNAGSAQRGDYSSGEAPDESALIKLDRNGTLGIPDEQTQSPADKD